MVQCGSFSCRCASYSNNAPTILLTMKTALYAFSLLLLCSTPALAQSNVTQTEVTMFAPSVPSGQPREGQCWTRSIAADRAGAWRCEIGNEIHDPCFQVPPLQHAVVCGADPFGKTGFVLKLTKPFPVEKAPPAAWPSPWILQLADGSICEPFTSTRPAINDEPAQWSCIKPGVTPSPATNSLVTKVHPGDVWTADLFKESDATMGNPMTVRRWVEAQIVKVAKVWE